MLKKDELASPRSCLNKAGPLEPVFVLRGKDIHAAQTVRHWAVMAEGTHEPAKIKEALELADQMERWASGGVDPYAWPADRRVNDSFNPLPLISTDDLDRHDASREPRLGGFWFSPLGLRKV